MDKNFKLTYCHDPENNETNEMQIIKNANYPVDINFSMNIDDIEYYSFKKAAEPFSTLVITLTNQVDKIKIEVNKKLYYPYSDIINEEPIV
ncbi:MAG: hypothetical protein N2510_07180 [Ignavibacteria bacterium]|nr:hypothetical protein [Ignavibacteria bacterium]